MSFDNNELKKVIADALNQSAVIPSGHTGAFVVHVDEAGVRTAVAFKTGNQWQVQGTVGWYPDSSGFDYGINVVKTW